MLSKLFIQKENLEYDLGYCKLYKTKHNGLSSTKIYYMHDSPAKYKILKTVSHYNILPVYRITQHSIFTKRIEPFSIVFDKKKRKYLKYVIYKLKNTIDYIHVNLNVEGIHLTLNSLFVDSCGNVVVGNFNKCKTTDISRNMESKEIAINNGVGSEWDDKKNDILFEDKIIEQEQNGKNNIKTNPPTAYNKINNTKKQQQITIRDNEDDYYYLNELSKQFLDVEFNDISEEDGLFEFLEKNEEFENLPISEKKNFLMEILSNKNEFIKQIKQNICKMMINSIRKSNGSDYKLHVLEFLFEFESSLMDLYSKELFTIIDTPVRFYLLKNSKSTKSLNECIEEICLGLQVKLFELKAETISFIFKNSSVFNKRSSEIYLEIMKNEISDSESIELICKKLIDLKRSDLTKSIYNLLMKFLTISKKKEYVYICIEEYFYNFNKQKVSSELLPYLCSKLVEHDGQDRCFILVEKIIIYLKKYKKEILKKGWSIDNLKGMFINKKEFNKEKLEDKYQDAWKNEIENEWESQENI